MSSSFLKNLCAATAAPCWLAYLPSFRRQGRPVLVWTALTSSHVCKRSCVAGRWHHV